MKGQKNEEDKPLAERIVDYMFLKNAFEDSPLSERQLADVLRTGRTQIRDALLELQSDGLIERRKKKGVYLKQPTVKRIAEIYDLRMVLEDFAIRAAATQARSEEIDELEAISRRFSQARIAGQQDGAEQANIEFHKKLVELSRNDMLVKMMANFDVIQRAFQFGYSLRHEKKLDLPRYPHEEIVKKLRERKPSECGKIIREHIKRGKQRIIEEALGFTMNTFPGMD